uniref:Uncharacterized mitochondrial protein AtMg00810-like n=1 Tax=Tanacetum cinerariifolium TaxID=118510 RepID=A0A6L2LWL7_TANCI|nr:uncharacterized mitochondrial protein AtMg00810-like [Tanacetum cinerariifolium]
MIGGLMYLIASRPDIAFATFVCARYQAYPTEKHFNEVKRIFWYLRQSINKGLWYLNDFGFELIAYSDADLAGNVLFQGMLILDAFLNYEICATGDYKEYEMVFVEVEVPINQQQPIVSIQGKHRTTPKAQRTPTLTTASPQGKNMKQGAEKTSSPIKSLKVTIKQKMWSNVDKMMNHIRVGLLLLCFMMMLMIPKIR